MNTRTKCLAITSAFEGAGPGTVSDARDGQGWSVGSIQWNFGRGTVQGLLQSMHAAGPATFSRCCTQRVAQQGGDLVDLSGALLAACALPAAEGVAWCKAREDAQGRPLEHWRAAFAALGAEPGFQAIEAAHTGSYMASAEGYMAQFGFTTERALSLLFDICVQEGSITPPSLARFRATESGSERDRLVELARAVGPQAGQWAADVESRKLCIAYGTGTVHDRAYNLASAPYFLTDGPVT